MKKNNVVRYIFELLFNGNFQPQNTTTAATAVTFSLSSLTFVTSLVGWMLFLFLFIRSNTRASGQEFLPFILTVRLLLARRPVFRHHHHQYHHRRRRCRCSRRLLEGKVFVSIYFVILKVSWSWSWSWGSGFLFRLSFRRWDTSHFPVIIDIALTSINKCHYLYNRCAAERFIQCKHKWNNFCFLRFFCDRKKNSTSLWNSTKRTKEKENVHENNTHPHTLFKFLWYNFLSMIANGLKETIC